MSKFHSLKIKDIRKETKDALSISFDIPENLQNDYGYLPGQYVTLKVNVNGLTFNRSYSLCSNPYEGKEHRIAIKRVPGGKVSTYLTQMAVPGEMIEVMLPMGNFHTDLNKDAEKHYYLFGAGSGITPLFSILKAVLSDEPKSKVTLVYGNYNSDAVIFKDELNVLASTHSDRFNLIHVFDKPEKKGGFLGFGKKVVEELAFEEGQINQARVRKVLLGQNLVAAEFYTCGPTGMMKAVESALTELNIDKEKIDFSLDVIPNFLGNINTFLNNVYHIKISEMNKDAALCWRIVTDKPNDVLSRYGQRVARVQISSVSSDPLQANSLSKELRYFLRNIRGAFNGVTINSISEKETIPDYSGDPDVHRKIIDFNFHYGEQP